MNTLPCTCIYRRVIYANRGEIFGHWDGEWSYTWGEIKDVPKRTQRGIEIILRVSMV